MKLLFFIQNVFVTLGLGSILNLQWTPTSINLALQPFFIFTTSNALVSSLHNTVTSRLDYCNSLLYGLPKSQIAKQRVQNAAARIVSNTHRFDHITPILRQLHWLPVSYRIHFKIMLLTFKALHGLSPKYIQDLVSIRKVSSYNWLRSGKNGIFLEYPSGKMLTTFGDRAFSVAAPKLWNALPLHIRSEQKPISFKCNIKTYSFNTAF